MPMPHSMPMSMNEPIVELTEFLSAHESRGFQEVVPENSEFLGHESADLDVRFLLALLKSKHRLSRQVSIPRWMLCLYNDGRAYYTRSKCRASSVRVGTLRAGIMFTDLNSAKPTLVAPTDLAAFVDASKTRFVVLNVGVYAHDWQSFGHANALIIDGKKTLDRYEPAGGTRTGTMTRFRDCCRRGCPASGTPGTPSSRGASSVHRLILTTACASPSRWCTSSTVC